MACHQAARAAVEYGYKNVYIMSVGIDGWKKAGKPVES
jgi:rhodanese-related sulfurtransferase